VFTAATGLGDDDVVLGEGQAIVFVDPAEIPALDLTESAARFVVAFLASDRYRDLAG
jgi:hypothetical protein